jgi:hypothetical protein
LKRNIKISSKNKNKNKNKNKITSGVIKIKTKKCIGRFE